MPDLGSSKLSSRSTTLKRPQPPSPTDRSSKRVDKKRASGRTTTSPPPRLRARRRNRSLSKSKSPDSSSSSSDSDASSDSTSSRSSKESPKKVATPKSQETKSTSSTRSKPTTGRSTSQSNKPEAVTSSKPTDNRSHRESVKKPAVVVHEVVTKPTEPVRVEPSAPTRSSVSADKTDIAPAPLPVVIATPTVPVETPVVVKNQPTAKVTSKPSKPTEVVEVVSAAPKRRSTSPPEVPAFTRILAEKLTRNVTKAHVTEIFSVWGEIEYVDMPPDRLHPEFSRSYAYITFKKPKSAMDAVSYMNGGQIDGETVRVTEVFSRSTHGRGDPIPTPDSRQPYRERERDDVRRDTEKPPVTSRGEREEPRNNQNMATPASRPSEDAVIPGSEKNRDRERPPVDEGERRREREREMRDRERQRDRERDRERERDRDRQRGRINSRDRMRPSGGADRPRRTRRGSSGSPFASRSGHVQERQRSPPVGSRYRRPSPPASSRTEPSANRRPRSRSPIAKPQSKSENNNDKNKTGSSGRPRRRGAGARSSSSSSDSSNSSSSSSATSRSGSSSSSSSSSSSASRSH